MLPRTNSRTLPWTSLCRAWSYLSVNLKVEHENHLIKYVLLLLCSCTCIYDCLDLKIVTAGLNPHTHTKKQFPNEPEGLCMTIPIPPLESSRQEKSKSAWYIFVKIIFGLFFQHNFPSNAQTKKPSRIGFTSLNTLVPKSQILLRCLSLYGSYFSVS